MDDYETEEEDVWSDLVEEILVRSLLLRLGRRLE